MYIQQEEIVEDHCAQIRQGVLAINKFVSYIHQLKANEITSQVVQMIMSLKNFCQQLLKKAKSDEIKLRVLRKRVLQLSVSQNINKQRLQACQAELAKADAKIEQLQKLNSELQNQKIILKSQIKQLQLNMNVGLRNGNQNQGTAQVANQIQDSESSIEGMAQCCEISFDSLREDNPDLYSSVVLEQLVHRDSNNMEEKIQEIQEYEEDGTSVASVEEMIQKLGISHANTKQSEEKTK